MRIVSHLEGTVLVRAPWEELRPVSGAPMPLLLSSLQTRYGFSSVGFSATAQQSGMFTPNLQIGSMTADDVSFSVNSIEFQPPFFIAVCSTTDNANIFIEDMLRFLEESFGFRPLGMNRQRYYRSTIIFDPSGLDLDETIGKWGEILSFLNAKTSTDADLIQTLGVRFAKKDFGIVGDGLPTSTPFILERRTWCPGRRKLVV